MLSAKCRSTSTTFHDGETAGRRLFQYCQIPTKDISGGRCCERSTYRTNRYAIPRRLEYQLHGTPSKSLGQHLNDAIQHNIRPLLRPCLCKSSGSCRRMSQASVRVSRCYQFQLMFISKRCKWHERGHGEMCNVSSNRLCYQLFQPREHLVRNYQIGRTFADLILGTRTVRAT